MLRSSTALRPGDHLQRHDCTPATAARCVALAGVRRGTAVLEPGAGTGAITAALVAAGAVVHAVELEGERLAALRQRFAADIAAGRVVLHPGDATRLVPRLAAGWLAVGNPPFQITSALLRRWLMETESGPAGVTLILQREAAQRLCGTQDGGMSRWSVLLHLAGKPRIAGGLTRDATVPPSRVDLLIFSWRRKSQAPAAAELLCVDRLLERAFAGPHTVAEALRGLATPTILRRQGAEHGWSPQAHPRTLSPEAWLALARFLAGIGKI